MKKNEPLMTPKLQINLKDCTLNSIKLDEYLTHFFSILTTILATLGEKRVDMNNLPISAITTDPMVGYRAERSLRDHAVWEWQMPGTGQEGPYGTLH